MTSVENSTSLTRTIGEGYILHTNSYCVPQCNATHIRIMNCCGFTHSVLRKIYLRGKRPKRKRKYQIMTVLTMIQCTTISTSILSLTNNCTDGSLILSVHFNFTRLNQKYRSWCNGKFYKNLQGVLTGYSDSSAILNSCKSLISILNTIDILQ